MLLTVCKKNDFVQTLLKLFKELRTQYTFYSNLCFYTFFIHVCVKSKR